MGICGEICIPMLFLIKNISYMETFKEVIINRTKKIREVFAEIQSNRGKLDFLKNYFYNKIAIIVGTGEGYRKHVDEIKNNFNDDMILICLKQSIYDFDMICDFHIYNYDNYEEYQYEETKPIVLFMNYSKPNADNYRQVYHQADINFFLYNLNGINKQHSDCLKMIPYGIDTLTFNDNNLGSGENMRPNGTHIMFEMALPLSLHMGCKVILTNGFVGNLKYDAKIKNPTFVPPEILQKMNDKQIEMSTLLPNFLFGKFGAHIFSLCDTLYHIDRISHDEFVNITKFKNLIVITPPNNSKYDIGGLVRYMIEMFDDYEIASLFLKNGIHVITTKQINYGHYYNEKYEDTNISDPNWKFICSYVKNSKMIDNSIYFGIHRYRKEILNSVKMKSVVWENDPHAFAYDVQDRIEKNIPVQKYCEKYKPDMGVYDYLITPSPIYFKNLQINEYDDKIKFLFYSLNEKWYDKIDLMDYDGRKNQIILSGAIGGGYTTRIKMLKLKNTNLDFDNLIYHQQTPGYKNNEHMTEMNYYKKLAEFKGAFVGHHMFPLNFLLAKHIEILMCGCLGFFQENPLLETELGLIRFKHYVPCADENNNLIEDVNFYKKWLESDKGREIALCGARHVRDNFGKKNIIKYIDFFKMI